MRNAVAVIFIFVTQSFIAQEWQKDLKENANFYEIQSAFNNYWDNEAVPFNEHINKKDGEYMHYKRWEYFMQNRLDSNGYFPGFQLYNEFTKKSILKKTQTTTAANWQYIGAPTVPDYGGAGRINTIEFDPTNSNIIWLGTASGGLWKTTNAGASWSSNTDYLANLSIADIAIDPSNVNTMYLATGDNSGYEAYGPYSGFWGGTYSAGLLKSIDGGTTWNSTGLTYSQTNKNIIQKIILFPNNPQILLVANRTSIQRSTNGGVTWTNVNSNHVYDFELDPSNPNIVYAVGNGFCFKSINQGLTWTTVSIGSSGQQRMSISISPSAPQNIYILNELGDLYLSTDSGLNFSYITNVPATASMSLYGYYDCVLAVSPTNSNEIYVAGLEIAQSLDGGTSWQVMSNWAGFPSPDYVHADNHYIEFLPNDGTTLFSCNDGGVFKSTDNATSWTDLSSNLEIAQYYRIATAQSLPSRYYMGQQDNGSVMADAGIFSFVLGGDGTDCVVDNTNPDNAIVSYQNGNLYNTTDNWATYNNITNTTATGEWITSIQLDPQNQNIIYAAYEDVYVSPDFGVSWNPISAFGLTTTGLEALAVAPSNSNYIYTSSRNTLFHTSDGGITWSSSNSGLPTNLNRITSICVSNSDPNKVWVTYGGYTSGIKVFMTNDGGSTWTNYSGTLPNIPTNTIVHQINSNDNLYVGTDFGVYYRDANMTDWVPFQTNLPNVIITELEIVPSLNAIRAATYGRGIWQSTLNNSNNVTGFLDKKNEDQFFTIMPNPSSGIFYLTKSTNNELYTVKIIDILGKVVLENIDVKLKHYKIDLSSFDNGCYSITVINKNEINSKKIVLQK